MSRNIQIVWYNEEIKTRSWSDNQQRLGIRHIFELRFTIKVFSSTSGPWEELVFLSWAFWPVWPETPRSLIILNDGYQWPWIWYCFVRRNHRSWLHIQTWKIFHKKGITFFVINPSLQKVHLTEFVMNNGFFRDQNREYIWFWLGHFLIFRPFVIPVSVN